MRDKIGGNHCIRSIPGDYSRRDRGKRDAPFRRCGHDWRPRPWLARRPSDKKKSRNTICSSPTCAALLRKAQVGLSAPEPARRASQLRRFSKFMHDRELCCKFVIISGQEFSILLQTAIACSIGIGYRPYVNFHSCRLCRNDFPVGRTSQINTIDRKPKAKAATVCPSASVIALERKCCLVIWYRAG